MPVVAFISSDERRFPARAPAEYPAAARASASPLARRGQLRRGDMAATRCSAFPLPFELRDHRGRDEKWSARRKGDCFGGGGTPEIIQLLRVTCGPNKSAADHLGFQRHFRADDGEDRDIPPRPLIWTFEHLLAA